MRLTLISVMIVIASCAIALNGCKSGRRGDAMTKLAGEPPVEWRLVTMAGNKVDVPRPVTLRLDKEHRASGQSFINNYFGPFTIGENDTFTFGQVGSTMMAGETALMESEHQYFTLLEKVNRFEVEGQSLMLKHDGETLLEFVRQVK